jgi:hypothetical protein
MTLSRNNRVASNKYKKERFSAFFAISGDHSVSDLNR